MNIPCQVEVVFKEKTMVPRQVQYYDLVRAIYQKERVVEISYEFQEGVHYYFGVKLENKTRVLHYNNLTCQWVLQNHLG